MKCQKERTRIKKVFISFIAMAAVMVLTRVVVSEAEERYTPSDLSGKRVAVLVGEGLHDGETLFPIGFLANRGAEITVVGIEPGYVKAYNSDTWVRVEKSVDEVRIDDYDAIVIPGGRSPAYLREHQNMVEFAKDAVKKGKVAAAICHGPQLLITAGSLDGRRATSFSSVAEELKEAGALYEDVPMIRDGNIITSRIPDDLPAFVKAIEQALAEK